MGDVDAAWKYRSVPKRSDRFTCACVGVKVRLHGRLTRRVGCCFCGCFLGGRPMHLRANACTCLWGRGGAGDFGAGFGGGLDRQGRHAAVGSNSKIISSKLQFLAPLKVARPCRSWHHPGDCGGGTCAVVLRIRAAFVEMSSAMSRWVRDPVRSAANVGEVPASALDATAAHPDVTSAVRPLVVCLVKRQRGAMIRQQASAHAQLRVVLFPSIEPA